MKSFKDFLSEHDLGVGIRSVIKANEGKRQWIATFRLDGKTQKKSISARGFDHAKELLQSYFPGQKVTHLKLTKDE